MGNLVIVLYPNKTEILIGEGTLFWYCTFDGSNTSVVTMYTTSGAQNAQHQWKHPCCKAFLYIKQSHILFLLTTCNLTWIENQTPSGQSYTLISTCTFSVGVLVALQSMTKTVVSQVKALDKAISGRQVGQAKGPWLTRRIQTTDQGMKFSFTANTRDRLD